MENNKKEKSVYFIDKKRSWKEISTSMPDSDLPVLCFDAISKKISLEEFNDMIKEIYKRSDKPQLVSFFNKFFNYSFTKITLNEYKKNIDYPVKDQIYYIFYDKKSKDTKFNKENLPYLLIMLNNITHDNIDCLHESKFTIHLPGNFSENIKELSPIFNIKNSAFKLREKKNFLDVNTSYVLTIIDDLLCEKKYSDEEIKKSIKDLKIVVPDFQKIVESSIFYKNIEVNKIDLKVNLGLFKIAEYLNINLFELFNNKYQKIIDEQFSINYNSIESIIPVYFDKFDFSKINFNDLDTKKNIKENFIYYSFLMNKLERIGSYNEILLNENIRTYLFEIIDESQKAFMGEEVLEQNKDNKMLLYDIYYQVNKVGLKQFLEAQTLHNKLTNNNKKGAVKKI